MNPIAALESETQISETSRELGEQLCLDCKSGDINSIRLNFRDVAAAQLFDFVSDTFQKTPLMLACQENHPNIVRLLVEAGANTIRKTKIGETAFYAACSNSSLAAVKELLRFEPSLIDSYDAKICFKHAYAISNKEVVRILLEAGICTNFRNVVKENVVEMVNCCGELMLEHDHIISLKSQKFINLEALNIHSHSLCRLLDLGVDFYPWESTLLFSAANSEFMNVVDIFVQRGIGSLDFRNHAGRSILMMATSVSMARVLLDYDIDVNATDYLGRTALMLACQLQNCELIELYLQRGANVNQADRAGITALHLLVQALPTTCDVQQMMTLLMFYGCDCDQADRQGKTTLMMAAAKNSIPWICELLPYVYNPHALDMFGRNALTFATDSEVAAILIAHGIEVVVHVREEATIRKGPVEITIQDEDDEDEDNMDVDR